MNRGERLRLGLLLGLAVLFAWRAVLSARGLAVVQPFGIDFLPMWTAARMAWSHPGLIYDFQAVTDAQAWLMAGWGKLRPWVYPPSTLVALAPFAAAPFWWAYAGWMMLGAATLGGATARAAPKHRWLAVLLVLLAPPAAIAAMVGQATLLVAGLLALAVIELPRRPRLAGVLFALAAAIKPQAACMVPLALLAARAWPALFSAVVAGMGFGGLALLLFGISPWVAWLEALPRFAGMIADDPSLMRGGVTLTALGVNLGLGEPALIAWRIVWGAAAASMVWFSFARTGDAALRIAALAAGALAVTPYAMHYEASLLAPAASLLALDRARWPFGVAAVAALAVAMQHGVGGLSVVAVAGLAVAATLWGQRKGAGSSRS